MSKQKTVAAMLSPLGAAIKKTMFDKGLTQEQLAENSKVSAVTLSDLENGKKANISLSKLIGVANAVGKTVELSFPDSK